MLPRSLSAALNISASKPRLLPFLFVSFCAIVLCPRLRSVFAAEVITKYRRQPSNAACPVHFEAHAADERGFGAGQIEHGVGDVECGGKASQRDGGQELGAAGLGGQAGVGVEHGVDAVHADVVGAEFGCHRFAGGDDGALGAVVPGQSGAGAQSGGGGDVDEAAAAGFAHRRHGVDGAQVDAFDVDGVDLVELVFADFEQGPVAVCPAGVVDHHVEPPVAAQGFVDQGLDLGGAGHVGLEEAGCAACGGDVGHHALAAGGIDVVDDDFAAFSGQAFGDAFA